MAELEHVDRRAFSPVNAPGAFVNAPGALPVTARAILNEDGSVIRVVRGFAPLSRHVLPSGQVVDRRGDDIVLTDAIAFDLKVYDPGAPVYGYYPSGDLTARADVLVDPNDPAWPAAYQPDALTNLPGDNAPATSNGYPFRFERQGAYVDLGYRLSFINPTQPGRVNLQFSRFDLLRWNPSSTVPAPEFFEPGWLPARTWPSPAGEAGETPQSPEYSVYDTWSSHYENNGLDEDNRDGDNDPSTGADEGVDGFDGDGLYQNPDGTFFTSISRGVDDPGERETRPPYEAALRGLQATLRAYERDSLQIREVKVRESFVPE